MTSVFLVTAADSTKNMDLQESVINGGVFISHHMCEGKHQYKIERVVNTMKYGKKMFVRTGDQLIGINGIGLDNFTPQNLARILSEGNISKLTVQKATNIEEELPKGEVFDSEESTLMSFSWKMKREEELDQYQKTGKDVFESMETRDLLVIKMEKTSVSVLVGRGTGDSNGIGFPGTIKDIVLVAESSEVTLVPRGGGTFRLEKLSEAFIEHKPSHRYLKRICSKTGLYTSPNPEKITIYYYKSNIVEKTYRGMPVALNFTDSNCFLKCCKEGDSVVLQIDTCEKNRLRQISKSDDSALAFVFYMKADRTKLRKFESALYKGWFICVQEDTKAEVEPLNDMQEELFLFIIQK